MKIGTMLERMESYLTERHLNIDGGYPLDSQWIGDRLVVAGFDPGKDNVATKLGVWRKDELLNWYRRAARYLNSHVGKPWPKNTANGFGVWEEAFGETEIASE